MKKIYVIMLLAAICAVTNYTQAQDKQYYSLGWDISSPVGSYSDYIGNTSLRGGFFSGNVFVTDNVSVGFKFGYNVYHQNKHRTTYQLGRGNAITAASYNYITSAPIKVGGYYHFKTTSGLEPYAGLAIGLNYLNQETLVQDVDNRYAQWTFLLNPEIGLRIPVKNTPIAFVVNVGYDVNFNSYEVFNVKYSNFQAFHAGVALSWQVSR